MLGVLAEYSSAGAGGAAAALLLCLALGWFGVLAVRLSLADIRTRRLPNVLILPSYPAAGLLLGGASLAAGEPERVGGLLVGSAALWGGFFALRLLNPAGLGFGDVKLAGLLGLYLGFLGAGHVFAGVVATFVAGGLWGAGLILSRRGTGRTAVPFGPFLFLGAAVAMLAPGLQ
ncbi:A24 family peptidase [Arthrobacter zhangbolii]|uniref:A24 family peptidase n=1 Tax=Arthrobacter zhangbolii TaxID=2886936 RepID=A0A9X1M8R1_9MICC|nr:MULTISPECIES: A24 family peptidase [Arthrobacter]MCC3272912.1 A24 family peptidase [Arthrobacter zhangbolii]MCC3295246.1 A24 family peptidase [Arthrobacter zhangbolii]MDN3905316.1 A24 family peptidase [Arthrobacter sp. YD2]UON92967.1 A24 family peptidase [Arthrobacter zhangbolii]